MLRLLYCFPLRYLVAAAVLAMGCKPARVTRPELRGVVTDIPSRCTKLIGYARSDCITKSVRAPWDGEDRALAGIIVEACTGSADELPSDTIAGSGWSCTRRGLAAGHPLHPTTAADGRFVIPPYVERAWRHPGGLRTILVACSGDFPFRFGAASWSPGEEQQVRIVMFPENDVPWWSADIMFAESQCTGIRHLYRVER